jgi:hypothetical protein
MTLSSQINKEFKSRKKQAKIDIKELISSKELKLKNEIDALGKANRKQRTIELKEQHTNYKRNLSSYINYITSKYSTILQKIREKNLGKPQIEKLVNAKNNILDIGQYLKQSDASIEVSKNIKAITAKYQFINNYDLEDTQPVSVFMRNARQKIEDALKEFIEKKNAHYIKFNDISGYINTIRNIDNEPHRYDINRINNMLNDVLKRNRYNFKRGLNRITFDKFFNTLTVLIENAVAEAELSSSGHRFINVARLDISIVKDEGVHANRYIETPSFISQKSVYNPRNPNNDYCILYCINYKMLEKDFEKCDIHHRNRNITLKLHSEVQSDAQILQRRFNIQTPYTDNDINAIEEYFSFKYQPIKINLFMIDSYRNQEVDETKVFNELVRLSDPFNENDTDKAIIDLLFVQDELNNHCMLIKNFTRAMKKKYNLRSEQQLCRKCLNYFYKEHTVCGYTETKESRFNLPMKHKYERRLQDIKDDIDHYMITFDIDVRFEDVNQKIADKTTHINNHIAEYISVTTPFENKLFTSDNCIDSFIEYIDEIIMTDMNNAEEVELIQEHPKNLNYPHYTKPHLSHDQKLIHDSARNCYKCNTKFHEDFEKMRDHNHLNQYNNYIGTSCKKCNFLRKQDKCVKILGHNASNYDFKIIFEKIINTFTNVKVIQNSGESFKTIKFKNKHNVKIQFLDTFNYIARSLKDLSTTHLKDFLLKYYKDIYNEQQISDIHDNLIIGNYDEVSHLLIRGDISQIKKFYAKSIEFYAPFKFKFNELLKYNLLIKLPYNFNEVIPNQKEIPNYTGKGFTEYNINTINFICNKLNCNFTKYYEIYTMYDSIILYDLFKVYSDNCLRDIRLHPCSFVSLSSLSYEYHLKNKECKINPITDEYLDKEYEFLDIQKMECQKVLKRLNRIKKKRPLKDYEIDDVQFYQNDMNEILSKMSKLQQAGRDAKTDNMELFNFTGDIRGGLTCVLKSRFEEDENNFMKCFDDTSQYPSAMLSPGPINCIGFDEVQPIEFYMKNGEQYVESLIQSYKDNNPIMGMQNYPEFMYDIEVDIIPNKELEYPVCVEKKSITKDMLHPQQVELYEREYGHEYVETTKLIIDNTPKYKYKIKCYYAYFVTKYCGYKITKVHRAVKYNVGLPFRKSVNFMNDERNKYKGKDMVKDELFKKLNNSFYGSLVMNEQKHSETKICDIDRIVRHIRNDNFNHIIFENDKKVVFGIDNKITLKRCRYYGAHILDYAKLQFFMLYFIFFKEFFGDAVQCYYFDTDSKFMKFNCTKEFYNTQFEKMKSKYNCIGGRLGQTKVEYDNIMRFIGLKAKSYCIEHIVKDKIKMIKKTKGGKGIGFTFQLYKDIYDFGSDVDISLRSEKQKPLKSNGFEISTFESQRTLLTVFDDKTRMYRDDKGELVREFYC